MEQTNPNQGYVFLDNAPELMKLLEDIFTDAFMQQHTRFDNFEGFQFSSAVILNWKADTLIYAPPLLDASGKESTQFGGRGGEGPPAGARRRQRILLLMKKTF